MIWQHEFRYKFIAYGIQLIMLNYSWRNKRARGWIGMGEENWWLLCACANDGMSFGYWICQWQCTVHCSLFIHTWNTCAVSKVAKTINFKWGSYFCWCHHQFANHRCNAEHFTTSAAPSVVSTNKIYYTNTYERVTKSKWTTIYGKIILYYCVYTMRCVTLHFTHASILHSVRFIVEQCMDWTMIGLSTRLLTKRPLHSQSYAWNYRYSCVH